MTDLLTALNEYVLLCDGAMGSRIQALDLDVDKDFHGHENCTDVLSRTRPDVIRDVHRGYFDAGSDAVITNSFGTSSVTLAEFGLQDESFDLSRRAAELAREVIEEYSDGRTRFVLGDIGPGTKLPSLGHIAYDALEAGIKTQCDGLVAGGIDAFIIETCQDPLQIKAAVNAAKSAAKEADKSIPIFVQVTVETTGTLLTGADIAAATTAIEPLDIDLMGLNCATGPQEMAEHVKWLAENWPGLISVQPNAGLPELVDGQTAYPLGAEEMADWIERFVEEDGVSLIGGCCGTDIAHIAALDAMLRRRDEGGYRPAPVRRRVHWAPALASLYSAVALRQENAFLAIGERCNANGSKQFRRFQEAEDWDGCVAMGRAQIDEGSHTVDLCTAFVGRDETADMTNLTSRMRGALTAPLVIDSTEFSVLEAALKLYGGKAVINSINFEDGDQPANDRLALARKYGAAVIALTIDEEGMAKTAGDKLRIAQRLYELAVEGHGLAPSDLLFDPLTFTICTGNEDDRNLAVETLKAIELIRARMPDCQIVLGLSNVSFGLKPAARHVLNSVFLHHAIQAGMTAAIVHVSKIRALPAIPDFEVKIAEDLIFDRRTESYDPLSEMMAVFEGRSAGEAKKPTRPDTVEERLKQRIIDGDRQGLNADLDEAMTRYPPLDIINTHLLGGMKVVGELFGAGQLQLPFVLQSAETMKAAVSHLEPHMEKVEGATKGTLVLATVKGDVHDIGKNLVDIILTNNGYRVINLGIKQPVGAIMEAARQHAADAVGMSGLLVKSTVIMRDNLQEMSREGIDVPVLLGGAALTRPFVETDCAQSYGSGQVAYARDAFDGLTLMEKVVSGTFTDHLAERQAKRKHGRVRRSAAEELAERPVDWDEIKLRKDDLHRDVEPPTPPFWGSRVIERAPIKALAPYLSETMLYQFQWGYKKAGRTLEQWRAWAKTELTPLLRRLLDICEAEDILRPQAVYGHWKCASNGNAVVLFDSDGKTEIGQLSFPRQNKDGGLCIADFFRNIDSGTRDVIGLQAVTMGHRASDVARAWFAENRYKDYLHLHGLSVEMAEALAEYVHKRIRAEWGLAGMDARVRSELLKQGYQGARYSFGYPACPNMGEQRLLLELLGASRIGLEMADEDQLHPEQSTAAVVVSHPQARYFVV